MSVGPPNPTSSFREFHVLRSSERESPSAFPSQPGLSFTEESRISDLWTDRSKIRGHRYTVCVSMGQCVCLVS